MTRGRLRPLWYGRIKGREPSWYVIGSTSPEP